MMKSSMIRAKPVAVRNPSSVIPSRAVRATPRVAARQQVARVASTRGAVVMASAEDGAVAVAVAEQVQEAEAAPQEPVQPAPLPEALLKLVISQSVAGTFIGSRGTRLARTTATSGSTIRVASRDALFSGTNERTAVVFGSTEVVAAAMTQLLGQKLVSEARDAQLAANEVLTPDDELAARFTGQEPVVLLLAVSTAVSEVFQPEKLASIGSDSGAELQLSSEEYGTEKVVSVSGVRDQVMRALAIVMPLLTAQPAYAEYMQSAVALRSRATREPREARPPREARAPAAPRQRKAREPREPRVDDTPAEPWSLETMQTSSQLYCSAEVVNALMTASLESVQEIAASTQTEITSMKRTKYATQNTIVQIKGRAAGVTSAVEQVTALLSAPAAQ
ncbi:MAG: hypothetical protein WDW36_001611 [Sanguina aurantia]